MTNHGGGRGLIFAAPTVGGGLSKMGRVKKEFRIVFPLVYAMSGEE